MSASTLSTVIVANLIQTQFPEWGDLAITPVISAGTDNFLFRLGDDKLVRLPSVERSTSFIEKEIAWLPKLKPLPLAIPMPIAQGRPGSRYPWVWSVLEWIEGENATLQTIPNHRQFALDLATFIRALQQISTNGAPVSGPQNEYRGAALIERDALVQEAIADLTDFYDPDVLQALWQESLLASVWDRPGVWLHGDIHEGNLLAQKGRLTAVIDFGLMGVGDPACDLIVAWCLLPAAVRPLFKEALDVDDATWLRGRGWALSVSLIALAYYLGKNPVRVAASRQTITEILASTRQA